MRAAHIDESDVDFVALTATQSMPLLINDRSYINYESSAPTGSFLNKDLLGREDFRAISPSPYWSAEDGRLLLTRSFESGHVPNEDFVRHMAENFIAHLAQARRIPPAALRDWQIDQYLSPLIGPGCWAEPCGLADLRDRVAHGAALDDTHRGLHHPIEVRLNGRAIPGAFINHHAAHAASSFYSSPFGKSLIVTHDGGVGIDGGFIMRGDGHRIQPLTPHHLACGQFYDTVAILCGLGAIGGAGKLMGLSSYSDRSLLDEALIGTEKDWSNPAAEWRAELMAAGRIKPEDGSIQGVVAALLLRAERDGFSRADVGSEDTLHPANTAIAHSAQKLVEHTVFRVIEIAQAALADGGNRDRNLCLSGGVALNCPTNSKLAGSGLFDDVYVEPHCDDGGLSLGAAWWLWHNLLDQPVGAKAPITSACALIGTSYDAEIAATLERFADGIEWVDCADEAAEIATDLLDDRVVAVYRGRSETGPRALGHRSILANPARSDNWGRVNRIKGREAWRPFAPIVLENRLRTFFADGPDQSPFMLMTHTANAHGQACIPAVIHVDRTSRVQTVVASDGLMFELLTRLEARGVPPVVLNTSFNGPGEPIVERPEDALAFLLKSDLLDAVYMNGRRVRRRQPAQA
ncbi:hypothetical protein MKK82_11285 [Methylobacterium sp. E-046]|nr:hypothetical protein [Methylobacterium sp. E-046]